MICDNGGESTGFLSQTEKLIRLLASSVSFGPDAEPVTGNVGCVFFPKIWDRLHTMVVNSGLIMFFF